MRRLRHSILAREDLADIGSYKLLCAIRERCQMLREYPEAGKRRDELLPGLWSYPVGPYVILYQLKPGDVLFINRVPHGRRDLAALFPQS